MAEKALRAPKEAALLIESGAVSRWYEANGWTYPVIGPTASGVPRCSSCSRRWALVKPPHVELRRGCGA